MVRCGRKFEPELSRLSTGIMFYLLSFYLTKSNEDSGNENGVRTTKLHRMNQRFCLPCLLLRICVFNFVFSVRAEMLRPGTKNTISLNKLKV